MLVGGMLVIIVIIMVRTQVITIIIMERMVIITVILVVMINIKMKQMVKIFISLRNM